MGKKKFIGIDVLMAAKQRISWLFDNVPKIYVSFSGGKDSGILLHLTMEEAIKRNRKIGVLFVDLEAQYQLTIEHIQEVFELYKDYINVYWVALPLNLRNAVSQFQPQWTCWDPNKTNVWVRQPPKTAITDQKYFPFFRHRMEFEEFTPDFGHWFADGKLTACLVGIRADESLNRWRTITTKKKRRLEGLCWTTWIGGHLYNAYPIFDWRTKDDWVYLAKTGKPYNKLYDRMHQAGLSIHQMRICQPYGDDQRKGLWLFQIIEPKTWAKILARVNGANQGSLYSKESGNILGNIKISKPSGHSWKSFSLMILDTMPDHTAEHYRNKIAVFLKWYETRGHLNDIPDEGPMDRNSPSWKRICKSLLRNDYWCKGLSFSQHKSDAYKKYVKLMKRRREEWKLI